MKKYQLKVGKVFYDDHAGRALVTGEYEQLWGIVKETKTHYLLELTEEDALELADDANHYAESGTAVYGQEMFGLCMSARATFMATVKQMRQQGYEFTAEDTRWWGLYRLVA